MTRIYIAGPMTGYPELNFPAFHAAANSLRAQGYHLQGFWGRVKCLPRNLCFINPLVVTVLSIMKRGTLGRLTRVEWGCVMVCTVALALYFYASGEKQLVTYALYISLVADSVAAIPTLIQNTKRPEDDRPFAWGMFAVAYGLGAFASPDFSVANMILPVYMFLTGGYIAIVLLMYRIKHNIPRTEWI